MKEKYLDVLLTASDDGKCFIEIYDPSSGDRASCEVFYDNTEHPEFNDWVGNEIYSWLEDMVGDDEK